jgi:serine/threonine-protein kinase
MGGSAKLDQFAGVGSVLAGKYRLERVVGAGGMGVVAVARHLRLGSRVAVKLMLPRPDDSERSVARFVREARTASRLTSAHVARVFDVDLREDGVPYIVMEFLDGETLGAALRRAPRLDVTEIVDDLLAACEALAEAHSLGVVHRDLKPGNLFRSRSGGRKAHVLKVLDFGISKTFESGPEEVASVTTGRSFVGSPPYMSPEQITSPGSVDARTDIWSLGVVFYECLTGTSPFAATTVGATCARILHEEPRPPSELRTELTLELDATALRCLSKAPEGRYQTVLELARALAPFGSEATQRSLSSLESQWANAEGAPSVEAALDSDRGDLSTETGIEPVPSLAGLMQSTFRRLPRGLGVGGMVALALVLIGLVVGGARVLRGSNSQAPTAVRQTAATGAGVPSVPASAPASVPLLPSAASPAAHPARDTSQPEAGTRPKPASRARAESARGAPSTLATALAPRATPTEPAKPAPTTAPTDPEAIYTDRK